MIPVKRHAHSKALYLSREIVKDIDSGLYGPGALLPQQDVLAERYGVSRTTLRRAMEILTETGRLEHHHQRGAVVPMASSVGTVVDEKPVGKKIGIAALWAVMADYPAVRIFEGMRKYAEAHGLVFTNYLTRNHEEILEILDHIEGYPAEGIYVCPYQDPAYVRVLGRLIERGYPLVAMRAVRGLAINTVKSDDTLGAYQATHYLIEKYGRPVYYVCEPAEGEIAIDRHQGYINAMVDAGFENVVEAYTCRMAVPDCDARFWETANRWVPGYEAAKKLLERIALPASIHCANDWVAKGVYTAAEERGLAIGRDLAVIGTDDLPFAKMLKPGLASVRPQLENLGIEAARSLHRLITGRARPPIHIRLPQELVIRESA